MSRSEGLVQRRIVSNSSTNDKTNHCNNVSDCVPNADPKTSYNNEFCDEDIDSKETRLTLMEEVLLLGLKDKEVIHLITYLIHYSVIDSLSDRVIPPFGTTVSQPDSEVVF